MDPHFLEFENNKQKFYHIHKYAHINGTDVNYEICTFKNISKYSQNGIFISHIKPLPYVDYNIRNNDLRFKVKKMKVIKTYTLSELSNYLNQDYLRILSSHGDISQDWFDRLPELLYHKILSNVSATQHMTEKIFTSYSKKKQEEIIDIILHNPYSILFLGKEHNEFLNTIQLCKFVLEIDITLIKYCKFYPIKISNDTEIHDQYNEVCKYVMSFNDKYLQFFSIHTDEIIKFAIQNNCDLNYLKRTIDDVNLCNLAIKNNIQNIKFCKYIPIMHIYQAYTLLSKVKFLEYFEPILCSNKYILQMAITNDTKLDIDHQFIKLLLEFNQEINNSELIKYVNSCPSLISHIVDPTFDIVQQLLDIDYENLEHIQNQTLEHIICAMKINNAALIYVKKWTPKLCKQIYTHDNSNLSLMKKLSKLDQNYLIDMMIDDILIDPIKNIIITYLGHKNHYKNVHSWIAYNV